MANYAALQRTAGMQKAKQRYERVDMASDLMYAVGFLWSRSLSIQQINYAVGVASFATGILYLKFQKRRCFSFASNEIIGNSLLSTCAGLIYGLLVQFAYENELEQVQFMYSS